MSTSQKSLTRLKSAGGLDRSTSRVFNRQKSYGFMSTPAIGRPVERQSQLAFEFKRPPLVYFPTYQVESYHPFNVETVTALAKDTLDELFTGHKYQTNASPALALRIAGEAMRKVKHKNYNRYRIIAVCTLGQNRSQSYNNTIGFIWDGQRDKYVDVHSENRSCFCQLTVFGVYLD